MVPNTRKILDTTATDQNRGVLLQVVAYTRDIGSDFHSVGKPNTCNFSKSRIGLFRCGCINTSADPALLRAILQCR
jgi:hypothetical protein